MSVGERSGGGPAPELDVVRAAGAVMWRRPAAPGGPAVDPVDALEVALVHRPKYDDWSWPKGKLDPGESWPAAAVREVLEETGLHVRLGIALPSAHYDVASNGASRGKLVRYWAAQAVAGSGELVHEVDEVRWADLATARGRLDYPRDRGQLDALRAAHAQGRLDTWPLLVLRHASAVSRHRWRQDDARRPLDDLGRACAADLVPVLSAFGVQRLLTSDAERCGATVAPYGRAAGVRVLGRHALSEQGQTADPARTVSTVRKALSRAEPAALCTHRPVVPALLAELAARAPHPQVAGALRESAGTGLVMGEALVAHVAGRGEDARVVAVERHAP